VNNTLCKLFNPESIAVLDSNFKEGSLGKCIMDNVKTSNYKGKIHAVNINKEANDEKNVYESCLCVKGKIDCAVVLSTHENFIKAVRDCVDKGLSYILMWTQENLESDLIKDLSDYAKKYGSRVIGPGNIGVYSTESELQLCLYPGKIIGGGVSVIAQNANMGKALAEIFSTEGLGISSAIALGEKIDVDEVDCLQYYQDDEKTHTLCMHLDDVKSKDDFLDTLKQTTKEKNVVVLSSGNAGQQKQKNVLSKELLEQCGAMVTESLQETIDWCRMLMVTNRMWNKENNCFK
jgi:acyl-CoA synthetase (NDP forming)